MLTTVIIEHTTD